MISSILTFRLSNKIRMSRTLITHKNLVNQSLKKLTVQQCQAVEIKIGNGKSSNNMTQTDHFKSMQKVEASLSSPSRNRIISIKLIKMTKNNTLTTKLQSIVGSKSYCYNETYSKENYSIYIL